MRLIDVLGMKTLAVFSFILCHSVVAKDLTFYVDGDELTLRNVERKCEVYRYDGSYGELECRGSQYRRMARKCEVYFPDAAVGSPGEIECRGSDYRPVERYCVAYLYSADYAEIDC